MNSFNVKTVAMMNNQFGQTMESLVVFVAAIVAMFAREKTTKTVCERRKVNADSVPLPFVPVELTENDRWFPSPVPETFSRDGYTVTDATFAGSGQTYTGPVQAVATTVSDQNNDATPVKARKPARKGKTAAQTVETERLVVKPARQRKASKPVVPALPDAPTERKTLQSLAKANGIKANGKSEDIVRQLREKGVVA